jgi:hypothetical protein
MATLAGRPVTPARRYKVQNGLEGTSMWPRCKLTVGNASWGETAERHFKTFFIPFHLSLVLSPVLCLFLSLLFSNRVMQEWRILTPSSSSTRVEVEEDA